MFFYYFLMILLALLVFTTNSVERANKQFLVYFFLIFIIFVGFRDHVGMDWNNYLWQLKKSEDIDFLHALKSYEPGFSILLVASNKLGWGIYGLNLISALFLSFGLYSISRFSANFWTSILAATPYLIYVIGMSATRQSIAIGLIFFVFSRWKYSNTLEKIFIVLLASTFHASAIVFLALIAFLSELKVSLKLILSLFLIFSGIYISMQAGIYDYYGDQYINNQSEAVKSAGALFHLVLIAIPATIYLINNTKFQMVSVSHNLLKTLSWASIILIPALVISTTAVDRFSLYFYIIPMLVFSSLPTLGINSQNAKFIKLSIVTYHFLIVFIWFEYGNNSHAWVPYSNILF